MAFSFDFFLFNPYFIGANCQKNVGKSGGLKEKLKRGRGWPYRGFSKEWGVKPSAHYDLLGILGILPAFNIKEGKISTWEKMKGFRSYTFMMSTENNLL